MSISRLWRMFATTWAETQRTRAVNRLAAGYKFRTEEVRAACEVLQWDMGLAEKCCELAAGSNTWPASWAEDVVHWRNALTARAH